jgi:hypothetical protein
VTGKFTSETAREAGRKGGKAKVAKKLSLARIQDDLGPLENLEDAQRWLMKVGQWAASGMLSGATAHACVRAVEVWIKSHESRLTRDVVDKLRARLEELEEAMQTPRLRAKG